jgi:4-hydroxybenzoate polyprenyltransferase
MGWAATYGQVGLPAYLLYAGSIFWVIGYDTIYAHQDIDDDSLIGVKSTAVLLGWRTRTMLFVFYGLAVLLIAAAGVVVGFIGSPFFVVGIIAFAIHLTWQVYRFRTGMPTLALMLFRSNRDAGLILFVAIMLAAV